MFWQGLLFLVCLPVLCAEWVPTFYGLLEVDEPVLLELIQSPAMQRLKAIHQYGISYYTTHREEYNRYDHSLGVFALLRKNGASLEEQIAGLLHDVSHTVFSHVGDWVFDKINLVDDYQNSIHTLYLARSGVEEILLRYEFSADRMDPKLFARLEQPLPDLCADRIDYNIQGAYFQHFLTKEEALDLFEDLQFIDGRWVISRVDLAKKLARFSLFMTRDCWGSPLNYFLSRQLADAMIQGMKTGLLSFDEIHFGTDQMVWDRLIESEDPIIQKAMMQIAMPGEFDEKVPFKCRGIDPWLIQNGQVIRLSEMDFEFAKELELLRQDSQKTNLK